MKFKLLNKIQIFLLAVLGEIIKLCIKLHFLTPKKLCTENTINPRIIVSLTSYGRRVFKVHYSIISLLRQKQQPDKLILWLDRDHWDTDKLPKSLKRLRRYGLSIEFCEDLKSYKKLIPTLNQYPHSLIITCDDDIYYRSNMTKRLIEAYEEDPTKIYAHRAHEITFHQGKINQYCNWREEVSNRQGINIFPTSGGGTLYSKELLYRDVCNKHIFNKLCPKADDIWNYFMGFLRGTKNVVLPYKGFIYVPLDVFYQALHKGSNLASTNCGESMNDEQIRAVMKYYHINDKDISGQ